jgi:hypothetical protein
MLISLKNGVTGLGCSQPDAYGDFVSLYRKPLHFTVKGAAGNTQFLGNPGSVVIMLLQETPDYLLL